MMTRKRMTKLTPTQIEAQVEAYLQKPSEEAVKGLHRLLSVIKGKHTVKRGTAKVASRVAHSYYEEGLGWITEWHDEDKVGHSYYDKFFGWTTEWEVGDQTVEHKDLSRPEYRDDWTPEVKQQLKTKIGEALYNKSPVDCRRYHARLDKVWTVEDEEEYCDWVKELTGIRPKPAEWGVVTKEYLKEQREKWLKRVEERKEEEREIAELNARIANRKRL